MDHHPIRQAAATTIKTMTLLFTEKSMMRLIMRLTPGLGRRRRRSLLLLRLDPGLRRSYRPLFGRRRLQLPLELLISLLFTHPPERILTHLHGRAARHYQTQPPGQ